VCACVAIVSKVCLLTLCNVSLLVLPWLQGFATGVCAVAGCAFEGMQTNVSVLPGVSNNSRQQLCACLALPPTHTPAARRACR
jgi:hypothetical protein